MQGFKYVIVVAVEHTGNVCHAELSSPCFVLSRCMSLGTVNGDRPVYIAFVMIPVRFVKTRVRYLPLANSAHENTSRHFGAGRNVVAAVTENCIRV